MMYWARGFCNELITYNIPRDRHLVHKIDYGIEFNDRISLAWFFILNQNYKDTKYEVLVCEQSDSDGIYMSCSTVRVDKKNSTPSHTRSLNLIT